MQKSKIAVWGCLKIAVKRREAKSKGEKERYIHLNAEFQRIGRRDKKAFLSDQCKETEENNRMGKTKDLLKKIRYTKGTFHAKMGTIKDRNSLNLTEAEDVKKRWQEYTEKLYKNNLHDPDNHNGVITHLEPDILECEVKWVLGSITTKKASRGDGIPVKLFQIQKMMLWKSCTQYDQQIWNTQQSPQDWKRSVFIPIPKKGNAKECSNYCRIAFISHACKLILKILQASLNSTRTENFQMFKMDLESMDDPEIKLPRITENRKGKRIPEKIKYFCFIECAKALTVWITTL